MVLEEHLSKLDSRVDGTSVPKVWLLTNAPSPYQSELFSEIVRQGEVNLSVRFMRSSSQAGQADGCQFPQITMKALLSERWPDEFRLHPRGVWEAATGDFDFYILSGLYTSVTFLLCAVVLEFRQKPWALWLERPHRPASPTYRSRRSFVGRLRDQIRGWLFQRCDHLICIGAVARSEYKEMGVSEKRLAVLPYCCDIKRYSAVDTARVRQYRRDMQFDGRCIFLFSGQMIDRKGVDTLIDAFLAIAERHEDVVLLLLGEGPKKEELQRRVASSVHDRVVFLGHQSQGDLPVVFQAADVFAFPSRHDGWAVVINEACAASLPVIATRQTGATGELVEDGRSGFVIEADDVDKLEKVMERLASDPTLRTTMGRRSRELVEEWSTEGGAKKFSNIVATCIRQYKRQVKDA